MSLVRRRQAEQMRIGRLVFGVFSVCAFVSLLTVRPAFADSAMFRGNSSLTGAYAEKITLPLALSWRHTANYAGYNNSSPAVVGDTAYFASGDRFHAVDANSGALKWRFPQDQPLPTRINASPAVSDGMVYFGGGDGVLYALNASTGKLTWKFDTRSSIGSSPSIVDGILYFGSSDGRVWALDAKTGSEVTTWKGGYRASDEISGAPAVSNGVVYVLSLDQVLHAVGAATGKLRGSIRLGGSVLRMSPVVDGDYVYVGAGANLYCFLARNLQLQRWYVTLPNDISTSPAVSEKGVFVVTNDNAVYCFDNRTGRTKWKAPTKLEFDVVAPPSISGNLLFVGTTQGGVYALDTDTGAIKWVYVTQPSSTRNDATISSTNVAAAPVIANKTLYVLSDDGALSAFRSDLVDTTPPVISNITIEDRAEMGIVLNGAPPIRFQAKLVDEGSGINPDSVRIMIDRDGITRRPPGPENRDKPGFHYDLTDSSLEYETPVPASASRIIPLADGRHTLTITASDWFGNVATKTWSFTVDNSVVKTARRKRENETSGMRGPGGPSSGGGLRGGGGGGRGGGRGRGGGGGGAASGGN
jgi:outer membrane protein assembly factor BamB